MTESSSTLATLPAASDSLLTSLRDDISGMVGQSSGPANTSVDDTTSQLHHSDSLRHKPFTFISDISPLEQNDVVTRMSLLLNGDGGASNTDICQAVTPECPHHGVGFARARHQVFASLADIHPAVPTANITAALPVGPGSLILSLHDESLVLGTVITIYTSTGMRNPRYELYNNATSIGAASAFCVSNVIPFCRPITARACLEERVLRRIFLRIPKTHVLFHYLVDLITNGELVDAATGRTVLLSRLHDSIMASVAAWQACIDKVKLAVAALHRSLQH
ncbi:hypothetical protein BOTBODRAFT_181796 [Botryobasidium botryosum FD-172 SS1]|uniref:Uncharacterized protein n=1 Tax=Botryobasidium botryosum (strain FD-172 SS1) TaxID=930990 RepID=A0A067LT32_BOTB1|nr:hypothetical protein BOTBODRAFT_181796 [Botryobasidium botryosum FD-172 SS1]